MALSVLEAKCLAERLDIKVKVVGAGVPGLESNYYVRDSNEIYLASDATLPVFLHELGHAILGIEEVVSIGLAVVAVMAMGKNLEEENVGSLIDPLSLAELINRAFANEAVAWIEADLFLEALQEISLIGEGDIEKFSEDMEMSIRCYLDNPLLAPEKDGKESIILRFPGVRALRALLEGDKEGAFRLSSQSVRECIKLGVATSASL